MRETQRDALAKERMPCPFAGFGTIVLEGYSAIGIEVTGVYAALARERVRQELGQKA